jgi:succinyl-CoA synthetase beta subunit
MKLYEFEAKQIFAGVGIPVPRGALAKSPEQVRDTVEQLKGPVVLKPQTLTKARGKAGLIGFAEDPQEADVFSRSFFGRDHAGEIIETILVEEKVKMRAELFLGIAVDYTKDLPVLLVGPSGGVEIETLAKEQPDLVRKFPVSPSQGLTEKEALGLAQFVCEYRPETRRKELVAELQRMILRFYEAFWAYDCELAEINPLVVREDFSLIALDANMAIDDESQFRHPELVRPRAQTKESFQEEQEFKQRGWTYLRMEGDIGILSSGAGITMAIMDLINLKGAKPANFLDTAQMNRQGIHDAFQIFHKSAGIKVLLVNIFAGLNRCDDLAEGIKDYVTVCQPPFPIVVRMIGNREEEGRKILEGIGITPIAGMEEAIDRSIALAG